MRTYSCGLVAAALLAVPAMAQIQISALHVTGNERLPAKSILAASGLRAGSNVSRSGLDAAAQKLIDTGLFTTVSYRYAAAGRGGSGYSVTFSLSEEGTDASVIADFPGIDSGRIWSEMKTADDLVTPQMPNNGRAIAYYQQALAPVLGKLGFAGEILAKDEADLGTGKISVVFRPAVLPKVASLRFSGNRRVSSEILTAAVGRLVLQQDYSERDLRRALDLNLRPIYEERALLKAAFPSLRTASGAGGLDVEVGVDEGVEWTLGQVTLSGEGIDPDALLRAAKFPEKKLAEWPQISASIDAMSRIVRSDGYLGASFQPERSFHANEAVVDLTIRVKKGRQFFFGSLQLNGLDEAASGMARKLWKIQPGAPMNALYVEDYLRELFQNLEGGAKSVSQELRRREGVVDVVFTFKK